MTRSVSHTEMERDSTSYPPGTLRCKFKHYWGVSEPGDERRYHCLIHWPQMGGEIFENGQWRRLKQNDTNGADVHVD